MDEQTIRPIIRGPDDQLVEADDLVVGELNFLKFQIDTYEARSHIYSLIIWLSILLTLLTLWVGYNVYKYDGHQHISACWGG